MTTEKNDLQAARRLAKSDRGFSVGELQFRQLSVDSAELLASFGLGFFIGDGEPPGDGDDKAMLDALMTIAWCLWADEEKVIDLSLDFDEATTKTAKQKCTRELKKRVRLFKSKIAIEDMASVLENLTAVFDRINAVDFDIAEQVDAPESEIPPGNY